ncbi:MAG: aspartate-semialdehyde dehydrogenase [Pseudohongiellaceae bacterium]|jgi:aspartate-semialdehyde dehydrogenase
MTPPTTPLPVAVLGATGSVGQRLISLLDGHPWFRLERVMASPNSVGQLYGERVQWMQTTPLPSQAAGLTLESCEISDPPPLVLSALGADVAGPIESRMAAAGAVVVSNAASHRLDGDVPLLVPEINSEHLAIAEAQAKRFGTGRLLTNPNCSSMGLSLALAPLHKAFTVERVHVVTLQALSGAGIPGIPAMSAMDNVIPHITGEEEKLATEPAKILGQLQGLEIAPAQLTISAQCTRVPVVDGHTLCVSVGFSQTVTADEVRAAWNEFCGPDDVACLPSAPTHPIITLSGRNVPQPRLHRDLGNGMSVTVGQLRPCPLLQWRFVTLSHNTVRGAAGGALLTAELAVTRGLLSGR